MKYYYNKEKRERTLSGWPVMLLTFSICLLCWVVGYFFSFGFPVTTENAVFPFWETFCKWLDNRVMAYFFGLLCMFLIAYIIQRISDIEMLIRERTRLIFIFFVILTSTNMDIQPYKEVTIVLLCLVFMIYELFNTYQLPDATGKLFNAGVLIGVAGFFMPQSLCFLPLLWVGMYQLQSLSYRSFLSSLIGVLTISWFVFAWCVWKDDFSMFTSFFSSLIDFNFFSVFSTLWYYQIGFVGIVLLMIVTFFYMKRDAINNRVRVRQMLSFLLNMSIWSLVLICIYGANAQSFVAVFYLPVSVLIAYFFENMRYRYSFLIYFFMLTLSTSSFIIRVWNFL